MKKSNNIKRNMLSLKSLQQELELLKTSSQQPTQGNTHNAEVAGHDIKGSYINRIYMKSGAYLLWIFTALMSYGHKLPFIGKIVTLLSLWYGRTTWWRILVMIRKVFVMFNALIGVYVVFKTVGFSYDNVLAGFTAMGNQYFEILTSFTKRLFNWFYDLFDHKVVPSVDSKPYNKGGSSWWNPYNQYGWYTKPMHNDPLSKIMDLAKTQEFYQPPFKLSISTPTWSYWDVVWYGTVAVVSCGLIYFGYKMATDEHFISNLFTGNYGGPTSPGADNTPTGGTELSLTNVNSSGGSSTS